MSQRKLLYLLLLIFSMFGHQLSYGQQMISSSTFKEELILTRQHFQSLIDTSNRLTIKQILENSIPFSDKVKITQSFNSNHPHWFRLQYKNDFTQPVTRYIHLGYASLVDVYVVQKRQLIAHNTEGVARPMTKRTLITGNYTQASFSCPANSEVTVYLKIKSISNKTIWLHPKLLTSEFWKKHKQNLDIREGIFLGFLWMMMFYSLALFGSLRDVTYLHYAIYIFLQTVYSLYTEQYIGYYIPFFGENLDAAQYFSLTLNFSFLFYFILMRYFNNLKSTHPRIDKFLVVWIAINIGVIIIGSILLNINLGWFYAFNDYFNLVLIIVSVAFLVVLFKYNGKLGRYFVLGSFCMLAGGMISVIGNLNSVPPYENAIYYHAGVILEIFIFSLGISLRFRTDQKEKQAAQQELIVQLRQNEELQTNYAQELELTVEERTSELKQKNQELEQAYTQITDSVNYAQRIQQAILKNPKEIAQHFKDLFIFFEPKDIVSGDFYWFSEVSTPEGTQLILAAADCTGHGVPGAFMTIMGNDFLTEIVETQQITQPGKVLDELDKKITLTLQSQERTNNAVEGMDIAIVSINQTKNIMQFAGAKNPLWRMRNGKVHQFKASSFSIGSNTQHKAFENNLVEMIQGDVFYIFSDGFQDQFGGAHDRKYMKRSFREFLLQISAQSMEQQRKLLAEEFYHWKANQEQTDDVLVIGFQLL